MRRPVRPSTLTAALTLALSASAVATDPCSRPGNLHALRFDRDEADVVLLPMSSAFTTETFTLVAMIKVDAGFFPDNDACDLPSSPCDGQTCDPGFGGAFVLEMADIPASEVSWSMWVRPSGRLALSFSDTNGVDSRFNSGIYVADGDWHMVAVSRQGGPDPFVTLSVDGIAVTCADQDIPTMTQGSVSIGARMSTPTAPGGGFPGVIDEVSVWDAALPRTFLDNLRHGSVAINPANTVGYWRFEEGDGQAVHDCGPNALHGILGVDGTTDHDPSWTSAAGAAPLPLRQDNGLDGPPLAFSYADGGLPDPGTLFLREPGKDTSPSLAALEPWFGPLELDPALGVDIDAFSLGLDLIPTDEDGVLQRERPILAAALPDGGVDESIWGAVLFSLREGTGHDGRETYSFTWGLDEQDELGAFTRDGGTTVAVRSEDMPAETQDVDALDIFTWLFAVGETLEVFWNETTRRIGPNPEPTVWFSVSADTVGNVPAGWCMDEDGQPVACTGATIFEWRLGANPTGPFVTREFQLTGDVAGTATSVTDQDDVDALAYDAAQGYVVFSTAGSNTGDTSGTPDPFLFHRVESKGTSEAEPVGVTHVLQAQFASPDSQGSSFTQVEPLSKLVSLKLGGIDPDGVCVGEPSRIFVPEPPCTLLASDDSDVPAAQPVVIDWTVAKPELQTGGCVDMRLTVWLTTDPVTGEARHQLAVRGALVGTVVFQLLATPVPEDGILQSRLTFAGGPCDQWILDHEDVVGLALILEGTDSPDFEAVITPLTYGSSRIAYQVMAFTDAGLPYASNVVTVAAPVDPEQALVPLASLTDDPACDPFVVTYDPRASSALPPGWLPLRVITPTPGWVPPFPPPILLPLPPGPF